MGVFSVHRVKDCSEINFLCIHKKLRAKRLAPVLIKEITRRCNIRGIFQAIYTAGIFLPTPISRCQLVISQKLAIGMLYRLADPTNVGIFIEILIRPNSLLLDSLLNLVEFRSHDSKECMNVQLNLCYLDFVRW